MVYYKLTKIPAFRALLLTKKRTLVIQPEINVKEQVIASHVKITGPSDHWYCCRVSASANRTAVMPLQFCERKMRLESVV